MTQNSQNYAFYSSLIDSDPGQRGVQPYAFGPAEFDVVMILSKKGSNRGDDGDDDDDDDDDDHDNHDRHGTTILHVVFDVGEPSDP